MTRDEHDFFNRQGYLPARKHGTSLHSSALNYADLLTSGESLPMDEPPLQVERCHGRFPIWGNGVPFLTSSAYDLGSIDVGIALDHRRLFRAEWNINSKRLKIIEERPHWEVLGPHGDKAILLFKQARELSHEARREVIWAYAFRCKGMTPLNREARRTRKRTWYEHNDLTEVLQRLRFIRTSRNYALDQMTEGVGEWACSYADRRAFEDVLKALSRAIQYREKLSEEEFWAVVSPWEEMMSKLGVEESLLGNGVADSNYDVF